MSAIAVDYTYRYRGNSHLDDAASGLKLATFAPGEDAHPYFFRGQLVRPQRTAEMLRALMQIVQARFHIPAAMLGRMVFLSDPVVTCSDEQLRFEGFSGCCGVYVRIDLLPPAVRGETFGRGTTNVDFSLPMVAALARIRDSDPVELSVGTDQVELATRYDSIVEKRVQLPLRWLKGFLEVQAVLQRMRLVHELPAIEARRFLRSLPRMNTGRRETWIAPAGRGLRLSHVAHQGAVRVGGLERLRVLESLLSQARSLTIHADDLTGASGWTLFFDDARFHLAISPEIWRGFSGEGQMLESLARGDHDEVIPRVHAALKWESIVKPESLAARAGLPSEVIRDTLARLGSRGLVGYDLAESAYFHRELPFDLSQVEKLQPRLQAARKLISEKKIHSGERSAEMQEFFVAGSGVEHRVRLTAHDARCTCPWFAKHGTSRGPCKHILAAKLTWEEA